MRAITVCINYQHFLAVTLPYNRHHFEDVTVVTDESSYKDVQRICTDNNANVVVTDRFYRDGALFNKWAALELSLDIMGRKGWLCIMDADIVWPQHILGSSANPQNNPNWMSFSNLYTPMRRMMLTVPSPVVIPPETEWINYPLHWQQAEWAGYTQIFHADDPVLVRDGKPWHECNWKHAGGADSFFQAKWDKEHKIRPPFEVLHLGEAGKNWAGTSAEAQEQLRQMISQRRGKAGLDRFAHERIKIAPSSPDPSK